MGDKLNFSVLNSTQIHRNPLNKSPAKLQYSFQKSPRFKQPRPQCPQYTYNLPDYKSKRSCSYGYGSKLDFTRNSVVSPGPFAYQRTSDFDRNTSVKRGKTFGTCRADMQENGYITPGPIKNPGSGNYNLNRELNKLSYSLRAKTAYQHNPVFLDGAKRSYVEVPGPGTYEQEPGIKNTGNHFFSKYKSSCKIKVNKKNQGATIINPVRSKRFAKDKPYSPGPSHYNILNQGGVQKDSRYILSKHRSFGTRAFSQDKRKDFASKIAVNFQFVPGPGSYRLPSDFGNYDHIDLHKNQSQIISRVKTQPI